MGGLTTLQSFPLATGHMAAILQDPGVFGVDALVHSDVHSGTKHTSRMDPHIAGDGGPSGKGTQGEM